MHTYLLTHSHYLHTCTRTYLHRFVDTFYVASHHSTLHISTRHYITMHYIHCIASVHRSHHIALIPAYLLTYPPACLPTYLPTWHTQESRSKASRLQLPRKRQRPAAAPRALVSVATKTSQTRFQTLLNFLALRSPSLELPFSSIERQSPKHREPFVGRHVSLPDVLCRNLWEA